MPIPCYCRYLSLCPSTYTDLVTSRALCEREDSIEQRNIAEIPNERHPSGSMWILDARDLLTHVDVSLRFGSAELIAHSASFCGLELLSEGRECSLGPFMHLVSGLDVLISQLTSSKAACSFHALQGDPGRSLRCSSGSMSTPDAADGGVRYHSNVTYAQRQG